MKFRHYWYEEPFTVPAEPTTVIEDRRLIEFEPPVQQPEVDKRAVVPYAFIRDKIKSVHIDRPWGNLNPAEGANISVGTGDTEILGRNTGFGWIMFFMAEFDYNGFEIKFYRDGEQIFPTFTPDEMWNTYGLDSGNHLPKIEAYDTSNDEYVIVYDPPSPMHFEASIWTVITNPDGTTHTISNWAQSVVINED